MANKGCLSTLFSLLLGGGSSSSNTGNSMLGGVVGDVLGDLTDGDSSSVNMDGMQDLLQGLGDTFSDLTGIGKPNSEASETAQMSGEGKISASEKKPGEGSSVFGAAQSAKERAREKAGYAAFSGASRGDDRPSASSVFSAAMQAKEEAKEKTGGSSVFGAAQSAKERAREKAGLGNSSARTESKPTGGFSAFSAAMQNKEKTSGSSVFGAAQSAKDRAREKAGLGGSASRSDGKVSGRLNGKLKTRRGK